MAHLFDGSEFIGLDTEAPGDGGAAAQPVDVFLEQAIRSNAYYLAQGRNSCSGTYHTDGFTTGAQLTSNNGDRAHCSPLERSTVLCIPLIIEAGMSAVHVCGLYNVQTEGGTQSDVRAWVTLRNADGEIIESVRSDFSNTDNAGAPAYTEFSKTLTFSRPWSGRKEVGRLEIWVLSLDGGDTSTNLDIGAGNTVSFQTTAHDDIGSTVTAPNNDPTGCDYMLFEATNHPMAFGMLGLDVNSTNPENFWIWPPLSSDNITTPITEVWNARYLSYIQFRGICIEPQYKDNSLGEIPLSALQAQKPTLSPTAFALAGSNERLRSRARMAAWGPLGRITSGRHESHPGLIAESNNYVDGDAEGNIIDRVIRVDGEDPVVEVHALLISTYLSASGSSMEPGYANWTFTLNGEQLADGDISWAAASSIAEELIQEQHEMPLWPARVARGTNADPNTPFLLQKAIQNNFGDGAGTLTYTFREGQLYAEDLPLIYYLRISQKFLSPVDALQTLPIRMRLTAEFDAYDTPDWTSKANDPTDLHLTCVGYAIYVHNTDSNG